MLRGSCKDLDLLLARYFAAASEYVNWVAALSGSSRGAYQNAASGAFEARVIAQHRRYPIQEHCRQHACGTGLTQAARFAENRPITSSNPSTTE